MKLSDLRIDAKKRQEGDWVPLGEIGGEVRVRGSRNYDWLRVEDEETARIRKENGLRSDLSHEDRRRVLLQCVHRAGLVDWRGDFFTDDKGDPIPFSPETSARFLLDPDFEVFADLVIAACDAMAFAAAEDEAQATKN